ncbi:MAG: FlgD immunoglobulin-like domain containing protein [Bacteroidota bacterium]|nr:FlgD immunoglobulin-like domain containing protein [Bacteroidota bacterium]
MKTARLFYALLLFGALSILPAGGQTGGPGTPPWEYWQDVQAPITDYNTTTSTIVINDVFTIESMQVMVDIQHTSANDLMITLSGPSANYILSLYNGSVYNNYENTIFDPMVFSYPCSGWVPPGAAIPGVYINASTNQSAYFRGVYKPQPGTMFPMSGSAIGSWTLSVTDNAPGDQGVLRRWALIFNRYGHYKDVRIGWDINYLNKCGQVYSRLPAPYVDDVAPYSTTYLYPYSVLGYRPQKGKTWFIPLIQNSKTSSDTRVTFTQGWPTSGWQIPENLNLNLPIGQFSLAYAVNLPSQMGTFKLTTSLYQRGDLYSSRLDNTKTVETTLTPGSLGYDNGVAKMTMNLPLNDCEANVYHIEQDQYLTSVDVWQGTNVELESMFSNARVSVRVWDASTGTPGTEIVSSGLRRLPYQGGKWVTYDFTPPVYLPAGRYAFGICTDVAPTTGGVGMGLDQMGSPFDPDGTLSKYAGLGVEFFSQNSGSSWSAEYLRQFGGKMIRPNFITGADVGVIAILFPWGGNLPSSFTPRVRFGSFANHPNLPNAVTIGKVYLNNSSGQTVYYSERRVSLQNAPYTADVDFDPVSGLASGTYTMRVVIERADDENLVNNSYMRTYVRNFAPVVVSMRGTPSEELRERIAAAFGDVEFIDRNANPGIPEAEQVLWVGALTPQEAMDARTYVKNGGRFMVLPNGEYEGDALSAVFQSIATDVERRNIETTVANIRAAVEPDYQAMINALADFAGSPSTAIMAKTDAERLEMGTTLAAGVADLQNRLALIASLPKGDISQRPFTPTSSEEISVEGMRVGDLGVAVLVPAKALAPRPVVEQITNPSAFELTQNYPNPFNPTTNIAYNLPQDAHVSVRVYDLLGREITTLVNASLGAGRYIVSWNGENAHHQVMPSGIYLYRMEAVPAGGGSPVVQSRTMVLAK